MHRHELRNLLARAEQHGVISPSHVDRYSDLLNVTGEIFSRDHFEPGHVTASSVLLSEDGASVALVDHIRFGVWIQPGGHVEPADDSLLEAAMRETREECGALRLELGQPLPFDMDVHDIPAGRGEPAHSHYDVRFLLRVVGGELAAADEVADARWFPLDGPPDRLASSVARLIERVRRLDTG